MQDLSSNISPAFFEELVQRLQNEVAPNVSLDIKYFHNAYLNASTQARRFLIINYLRALAKILEEKTK